MEKPELVEHCPICVYGCVLVCIYIYIYMYIEREREREKEREGEMSSGGQSSNLTWDAAEISNGYMCFFTAASRLRVGQL